MGPKTKSAHLLRWHYGDRVTMGQFSNSFPKYFSYLCEYAFRFDLSCSFCEYPFIFHCLHCSPSCFDPDSLLLAHLWLGLSWIDYISANKRFSSPKTISRKPYTSSKQQERQKHSVETTINLSILRGDIAFVIHAWFIHGVTLTWCCRQFHGQGEHIVSPLPKVDLVLSLTVPLSPNSSYFSRGKLSI